MESRRTKVRDAERQAQGSDGPPGLLKDEWPEEETIRPKVREILAGRYQPPTVPNDEVWSKLARDSHWTCKSISAENIWKLGIVVNATFLKRVEVGELPRPYFAGRRLVWEDGVELVAAYFDLQLTDKEAEKLEYFIVDKI